MSFRNVEMFCSKTPFTEQLISRYKYLAKLKMADLRVWIPLVFIPLILCVIIVWPFYLRKFHRNSVQYGTSLFLPMITYEYRAIKYIYPLLLISSVIAYASRSDPLTISPTMISSMILACAIHWFSFTYETLLGLMSILKYLNLGHLTKRTVVISMCLILLTVIAKDIGFFMWSAEPLVSYDDKLLDKVILYYYISYVSFQIVLFVGMVLQFATKSKTDQLSRQTKIIGAIKLVLLTVFLLSTVTEFLPEAGPIFVCVDGLLVPVAVMLAEIMSPSPVDEIKKAPLKV